MTVSTATIPGAHLSDPLASLHLTATEREALAQQGFIAAEIREAKGRRFGPYFKLRWRQDGRQKTRYLGRNLARAQAVSAALVELQRPMKLLRDLTKLMEVSGGQLREAKQQLEARFAGQGWY